MLKLFAIARNWIHDKRGNQVRSHDGWGEGVFTKSAFVLGFISCHCQKLSRNGSLLFAKEIIVAGNNFSSVTAKVDSQTFCDINLFCLLQRTNRW